VAFRPGWRGHQVIDGGHVLHLLAEGADAFEFAIRRRETEFIFGHGLGGRNQFGLDGRDAASKIWATVFGPPFACARKNHTTSVPPPAQRTFSYTSRKD